MEHRNSVLIVEDDVNINGLLKEALEKEGYICTQAFSGTEARMILQGERYSVILLDLMLPGIPGEEVLRDIRKKGNTPVIILTAKGQKQQGEKRRNTDLLIRSWNLIRVILL